MGGVKSGEVMCEKDQPTMSTLITPQELHTTLPRSQKSADTVTKTREQLISILNKQDDRLVVIVGPCSIHDPDSALRYAKKLRAEIQKHHGTLCIIMRAYLEKARTSTGWKGFVNDPHLNLTFEIQKGLHTARSLLLAINELGVPAGTEILNPFIASYFSDLTSWAAIGARTTESQVHREFAASLPMPVGFKNNTNGDIQVAIDAIQTAIQPHHFLGVGISGKITVMESPGNPHCHVVLRGSQHNTNYDDDSIDRTIAALNHCILINQVMIDCSHGNTQKEYRQQLSVIDTLSTRIAKGDRKLLGVMLESHLIEGKQPWIPDQVMSGDQSITDPCIGWEHTEIALNQLSHAVLIRRKNMLD